MELKQLSNINEHISTLSQTRHQLFLSKTRSRADILKILYLLLLSKFHYTCLKKTYE